MSYIKNGCVELKETLLFIQRSFSIHWEKPLEYEMGEKKQLVKKVDWILKSARGILKALLTADARTPIYPNFLWKNIYVS